MELAKLVKRQRAYYETGATRPVEARIHALKRLRTAILRNETEIHEALYADLRKSAFEGYMTETGLVLDELTYQMTHIRRWSRPKRAATPVAQFPAKSFSVREPYGVTLVMAPWNYPFQLSMEPLVGAVAAGNCVVLKPSAYAPATARVLAKVISEAFPPEHVTVVQGGRRENAGLLAEKFDYIFFTGSVQVGRIVMEAAARHLTPVTLELGGKSPCIVDSTANLRLAAKRIVFGKFLNAGQTCVAPDYLLVDRTVKEELVFWLAHYIHEFLGDNPLENSDYSAIINRKHFDRLLGLIQGERVLCGGRSDPESLRIAPTLLGQVSPDSPVMKEEIFGPVLPVLTYTHLRQAADFIAARPKPLAFYLFTRNRASERYFMGRLSFGGGCINDTIVHLATSRMGFGGVGESGMGSYHGRDSFETFTHKKSVLKKSCLIDLPVRYHPYTEQKGKAVRFFLGR